MYVNVSETEIERYSHTARETKGGGREWRIDSANYRGASLSN